MGDVHYWQVVSVRRGVSHLCDSSLWHVVLEPDRRDIAAGAAAGPLFEQRLVTLVLKHDNVDRVVSQLRWFPLDRVRWPIPCRGAAATVASSVRNNRDQIRVCTLNKRVHP